MFFFFHGPVFYSLLLFPSPPLNFLPSSLWLLKKFPSPFGRHCIREICDIFIDRTFSLMPHPELCSYNTDAEPTPSWYCRNDKFIFCYSSNLNDVKSSASKNVSDRIKSIRKTYTYSKKMFYSHHFCADTGSQTGGGKMSSISDGNCLNLNCMDGWGRLEGRCCRFSFLFFLPFIYIYIYIMVDGLNCKLVVCEFELQSHDHVLFWTYSLEVGMNLFIHLASAPLQVWLWH